MSLFSPLLAAVFPALVIVAALLDLTSFRIPNWISIALVAAFAPAAFAAGMDVPTIGLHLAIGLGALVAGMVMFALGWIGGGDAKLFAAAGLWVGLQGFAPFIAITALAGGALALILVSMRHSYVRAIIPAGPPWLERLREPKGDAPYGVAIAAGALFAFPASGFAGAGLGLLGLV
jgi:prepilin peptidase CpaA